jgi:hypothetical protein
MLFLVNYYNPADPTDVDHHEQAFYANQMSVGGGLIGLHFDPKAPGRHAVQDPLWPTAGLINDVPRLGYNESGKDFDGDVLIMVTEIVYVGF